MCFISFFGSFVLRDSDDKLMHANNTLFTNYPFVVWIFSWREVKLATLLNSSIYRDLEQASHSTSSQTSRLHMVISNFSSL